VDLLPVVLESKAGRELKAYRPVFIHNCLEKRIGSYKGCSPLRNGNLIVKCCSVQQTTTLLQCTKLTDGAVSVKIAASSMQPLGARGVIYNVPLDISADDLVACLASQGIKFVKRFRFKSSDSYEMKESQSVFLQFTSADLSSEMKIGYLLLRVKQCVPRPLRCFTCNRCGHAASHCREKLRCSICSGEPKHSECSAAAPKCPNCGGGHSAIDKVCPRYKRETEILKLKKEAKLSYADVCKGHRIARSPPVSNMVSQSAFPPLLKKTGVDRTQARSIVGAAPFPHAAGVPPDQDEMIITEQLDFSSLLFDNPVTFLTFLVEVIRQTMLAKDNESIDVCQSITKAAGDRIGLPADADQLQLLSS